MQAERTNTTKDLATINTVNPFNGVDFRPFLEGISTVSQTALVTWIAVIDNSYVVPVILPGHEVPCGYVLSENDVDFVKTMLIELV